MSGEAAPMVNGERPSSREEAGWPPFPMEPRRDWFEMARERDAEERRRRAAEAALRRIARQAAEEAAEAMAMANSPAPLSAEEVEARERAAEEMRQRTAEATALRQARMIVEQELNARIEQQRRAREEEDAERALLSPGSDDEEANSAPPASLEPLVASRSRWTLEDGMLVEVGDPASSCDVTFDCPRIATAQIPRIAADCHVLPPDEDPPRPVFPLGVNPLGSRQETTTTTTGRATRMKEEWKSAPPKSRCSGRRLSGSYKGLLMRHPLVVQEARGAGHAAGTQIDSSSLRTMCQSSDASEDEPAPPRQRLRPNEPRPDRHAPSALEGRGGGAEQQQKQHEFRPQPGGAQVRLGGIFFGGHRPIPTDPTIDPPAFHCFNCWQPGHGSGQCPRPKVRHYCRNSADVTGRI